MACSSFRAVYPLSLHSIPVQDVLVPLRTLALANRQSLFLIRISIAHSRIYHQMSGHPGGY